MVKVCIEVGQKFKTKSGEIEVLNIDKRGILVRFENGYQTITKKRSILDGSIRNPYFKRYFGVGFSGEGVYKMKGTLAYTKWYNLMVRCYDEKYKESRPTYEEASCCPEWHNFQNFAEWVNNQEGFGKEGFELDKDILNIGNKIYSPDNCIFVPGVLNVFFSSKDVGNTGYSGVNYIKPTSKNCKDGYIARCFIKGERKYLGYYNTPLEAYLAYREVKIRVAKELARKWEGQVDNRVIEALLKFEERLPSNL